MASQRIEGISGAIGRGLTEALAPLRTAAEVDEDNILDVDDVRGKIQHLYDTDRVLYDYYTAFHSTLMGNYRKAEYETKAEGSLKVYREWREKSVEAFKALLEHHFPDRWDVQDIGVASFEKADRTLECLSRGKWDVNMASDSRLSGTLYQVVILFPEFVITNSRRQEHTIKDLYIKFQLDHKLSMKNLCGWRGTKSIQEYRRAYSHSHMRTGNGWSAFCLGSTSFETLVGELGFSMFDEMKYELFMQTLPDYLRWESLEGGPHITIQQAFHESSNSARAPEIHSSTRQSIISRFISGRPKITYNVTIDKSGVINVSIVTDISFIEQLTKYTPDTLHYPMNTVTLSSAYPSEDNMTDTELARTNASFSPELLFKGNWVKLRIEKQEKDTEENKIEKYADSRLISWAVIELKAMLTDYIYNSFWYGTSKKVGEAR